MTLIGRIAKMVTRCICWLALTAGSVQAATWTLIERGGFQVYSSTGTASGQSVLETLESMEGAFTVLHGPLPSRRPPVRVYLFASLKDFNRFRDDNYSKGFYQSGPDFDIIALISGGPEMQRTARHEFIHLAAHRAMGPMPRWFEEGLADFYSTLAVERGSLIVGRAVPEHLDHPSNQALTAAEMRGFFSSAASADRIHTFYAQCWALVHYLRQSAKYGPKFDALIRRITAGEDIETVFPSVLGRTIAELLDEALRAARLRNLPVMNITGAPRPAQGSVRTRELTEAEGAEIIADLFIALGRRDEAAPEFETAARLSPKTARAAQNLAMLALRRADNAEAERQLRRAISLGSLDPATHFELAMLLRDRDGATAEVIKLLERTLELNPAHPEAWFVLGSEAERRGQTADAAKLFERAVSILPRQFPFRESLARAYLALGRRDDALAQARIALACARTGRERSMAEGLEALVHEPAPAPARAPKPPAAPKPDVERVEGQLIRIDCENPMRFVLKTSTGEVTLSANNPADVRMTGAPSDFACGPQKPARTVAAGHTGGRLVTLEFK